MMPESVEEDIGIYRSELTALPKQLRAQGIDASFAHPAELRRWRELLGPTSVDVMLAVTASFLASGGWDVFKASIVPWFSSSSRKMSLLFFIVRSDGTSVFARVKGDGSDVQEALGELRRLVDGSETDRRTDRPPRGPS